MSLLFFDNNSSPIDITINKDDIVILIIGSGFDSDPGLNLEQICPNKLIIEIYELECISKKNVQCILVDPKHNVSQIYSNYSFLLDKVMIIQGTCEDTTFQDWNINIPIMIIDFLGFEDGIELCNRYKIIYENTIFVLSLGCLHIGNNLYISKCWGNEYWKKSLRLPNVITFWNLKHTLCQIEKHNYLGDIYYFLKSSIILKCRKFRYELINIIYKYHQYKNQHNKDKLYSLLMQWTDCWNETLLSKPELLESDINTIIDDIELHKSFLIDIWIEYYNNFLKKYEIIFQNI